MNKINDALLGVIDEDEEHPFLPPIEDESPVIKGEGNKTRGVLSEVLTEDSPIKHHDLSPESRKNIKSRYDPHEPHSANVVLRSKSPPKQDNLMEEHKEESVHDTKFLDFLPSSSDLDLNEEPEENLGFKIEKVGEPEEKQKFNYNSENEEDLIGDDDFFKNLMNGKKND